MAQLFEISQNYYQEYENDIKSMGYTINPIHIKTNLYNFKQHLKIFKKYKVSISGSVDLPLSLHEKYRVDKYGKSTLPKIIENLKILSIYPHHKKISCVVTKEHLLHIDEFIEDIKYIHYDIGLDMTKFNVMFSFDSEMNSKKFDSRISGTEMLNHNEQVVFYKKIYKAFEGSELDYGLRIHWFKEFTPEFCCSSVNCGNKFFLVQSDGEVYSCPRGQSSKSYYYGNIYKNSIDEIVENGWKSIETNENKLDIHNDCLTCEYFPYCNLGCTFVRSETNDNKSYTCKLQKELYRDNPQKYPPYSSEDIQIYVKQYLYRNKFNKLKKLETFEKKTTNIIGELYEDKNSIANIIKNDTVLQKLYSDRLFYLEVNGTKYQLSSQILKNMSNIIFLDKESTIYMYAREDIFSINSSLENEVNNYFHIMILRDTPVVYGDEQRTKQEHLFDYSLYKNSFIENSKKVNNYYKFELSSIFLIHSKLFRKNIKNNLFVTTKTMREYHYTKHKKNAFYHIQAINLPFANIEFYWLD